MFSMLMRTRWKTVCIGDWTAPAAHYELASGAGYSQIKSFQKGSIAQTEGKWAKEWEP